MSNPKIYSIGVHMYIDINLHGHTYTCRYTLNDNEVRDPLPDFPGSVGISGFKVLHYVK